MSAAAGGRAESRVRGGGLKECDIRSQSLKRRPRKEVLVIGRAGMAASQEGHLSFNDGVVSMAVGVYIGGRTRERGSTTILYYVQVVVAVFPGGGSSPAPLFPLALASLFLSKFPSKN